MDEYSVDLAPHTSFDDISKFGCLNLSSNTNSIEYIDNYDYRNYEQSKLDALFDLDKIELSPIDKLDKLLNS